MKLAKIEKSLWLDTYDFTLGGHWRDVEACEALLEGGTEQEKLFVSSLDLVLAVLVATDHCVHNEVTLVRSLRVTNAEVLSEFVWCEWKIDHQLRLVDRSVLVVLH